MEGCYTEVTIQKRKLKVVKKKGAEIATYITITNVIIINSIIRRFYWPSSPTSSSTRTR
jgi:hypothetical protein